MDYLLIGRALLGIVVFFSIAWMVSENRKSISFRIILVGVVGQISIALVALYLPGFTGAFKVLAQGMQQLQRATLEGTSLVFGYVGGGPAPFEESGLGTSFILAFQTLPLILVIGALSALLWHWGVMSKVVKAAAWVVERAFGVSGAVGVATAANIFMGMVEASLIVRFYIPKLNRSELFVIMACGMSTIAGSHMVLLGTILSPSLPDAFSHMLVASLINAPAAIALAKVMIPSDKATDMGTISLPSPYKGALDAISRGTLDAIQLLVNVVALLIVFVSLIALANTALAALPFTPASISFQNLLGVFMAPVAWLMGIPWEEAATSGGFLGTKMVVNELVAYLDLAALEQGVLSERSYLILTYALCSFGNLGSVAIMVGGLTAIAPERRDEIVSLGGKSVIAAFLTSSLTGTTIGLVTAVIPL